MMTTNLETITPVEAPCVLPSSPPVKPTLWHALKLSVASTIRSLPVLLFAFFLLLVQLMLLPQTSSATTLATTWGNLLPWLFCLLSIGCLSVLFQAGWMHVLVERTQAILNSTHALPPKITTPTDTVTPPIKPIPEPSLLQIIFSGIGQFGQDLLGYYALQLIALFVFLLVGAWVLNTIGIPSEFQNPQLQQTVTAWLKTTPSQQTVLQTLQEFSPQSINQISALGMVFSLSMIILTLFVLLTSFLPSLIVTKQVSFKTALILQLQLIKQYPVQTLFISSFQVVGGGLLPLLLPRSDALLFDILLYFGTYIGMLWSQAFPIAYLLIQTNFPKKMSTDSPISPPELDLTA
jgi:hypothetical protein